MNVGEKYDDFEMVKVDKIVSESKTAMEERTLTPVGDTAAFLVWLLDTVIRDAVPLSTESAVTTLHYL